MWTRRILTFIGLLMIGESIAVLLRPRGYLSLWRGGPESICDAVDWCSSHPREMRAVGMLELGLGLFLTLRETNGHKSS